MCKYPIPIKSKNIYNITKAFVPCGKCEECRTLKKTEWTNRLLIEMDYYQKVHKYKVGFITLTYNEQHLPHIPSKYLIDKSEKIPCFNYQDIRQLNNTIRKFLWSKFNLKNGYRHFITCEYGEKYHRPHMHGIILFHPMFTHLEFYKFIEDAWTGTTQYIQNNKKRKTERENKGFISTYEDFVPKDTHKVGGYVAKYVCKDIEYEENIDNKIKDNLTKKEINELRSYAPFHRQSIGLSKCIMNDKEILDKLKNGISVIGSTKTKELPNYIKERLAYTKHYTYNLNAHKHETQKQYTKTYYENKEKFYNKKLEQSKELFKRLTKKDYWEAKQKDIKTKLNAYQDIQKITDKVNTDELAKFYTTYYGVEYKNCVQGKNHEILFERYNPCADMSEKPLIDYKYYVQMTTACDIILGYSAINQRQQRSQKQEIKDKIKSFWTNLKQ